MYRLYRLLLVTAFLGVLQLASGERKLYRKSRSVDLDTCDDNGGFLLNDICYILGSDVATWEEARDACYDEFDGDLAVVTKKVVYDYIMEMMDWELEDGAHAWIGLSDIDTEGLFEWVDGYVDYEERGDYWDIFWEWSDDSLGEYPDKNCVIIDKDTGEATETDCEEQHYYVCEIITYPDDWELDMINEEIEWEKDLVEMLSNASVMQQMEVNNKEALNTLYEFDIKLNKEEADIFESGGDPSSATGAFNFQAHAPSQDELAAIKEMIDEHGIQDWDPATREHRSRRKRSALGKGTKVWPGGVVPYKFKANYPADGLTYVMQAMRIIEKDSCIRFKERTNEEKYMVIDNAQQSLCFSAGIGYPTNWWEKTRDMNFGWCWNNVGSIIHEFYHALGFWHEMARPDRDDYIEIIWKNVQPGENNKFQFQKAEKSTFSGYPYDYMSLMHYHLNAMAIDKTKYTMKPVGNKLDVKLFGKVGHAKLPTKLDRYELNSVYKCGEQYMKQISSMKDGAVELDDKAWGPCSVTCGIGEKKKESKLCLNYQCFITYTTDSCYMPACPKPGEVVPTASPVAGVEVKQLAYTWGGCWKDERFPSSLASLEGKSKYLDGKFKGRSSKIQKCANAAKELGSAVFGLKFGGKCLAVSSNAKDKNVYKANGPSIDCKGFGTVEAMDVYLLDTRDVQGEWGSWGDFGGCSKTCGSGQQSRKRVCENPKPKGSGSQCKGKASGTGKCATGDCPVDGGWGEWAAWSNDYCDYWGYKMRERKCDNPKPKRGGAQCWSATNFVEMGYC